MCLERKSIVCRFSHSSTVHFHLASYVCLRRACHARLSRRAVLTNQIGIRWSMESYRVLALPLASSQLSSCKCYLLSSYRWQVATVRIQLHVRTYLIFASFLEQRKSVHERIALCVAAVAAAVLVFSLVNLVKVIEPIVVTEYLNDWACTPVN